MNGSFKDIPGSKTRHSNFLTFIMIHRTLIKQVSNAFRDCCIFDTGVIYIDENQKRKMKSVFLFRFM